MYESETVRPGRDLRRAEAQAATIGNGAVKVDLPPKRSSFLAATQCELESAIKNLVDLNGRLGALADRVFGSPAEPSVSGVQGAVAVGGAVSDIEQLVNAIHSLVQQAHYTAARLESL